MELVEQNLLTDLYIKMVEKMASDVMEYNLNIDYYPTNFIVKDNDLYYIDYECNIYDEKWSFSSWGITYWKNRE